MSNVSPLRKQPTFWDRLGDIGGWIIAGLLFCLLIGIVVGGAILLCIRIWTAIFS